MNAQLAETVDAILNRAVVLRAQLNDGHAPNVDEEQQAFKDLLTVLNDETLETDGHESLFDFTEHEPPDHLKRLTRGTLRRVLTCFVDEWFTQTSALAPGWREATLEADLFSTAAGGLKFWEEARYAETRGDLDALEVMHVCVMLGYRGQRHDCPQQIEAWAARIRARLEQEITTWAVPVGLEAAPCETRHAIARGYHRMAFSILLTAALMLPLMAAVVWRLLPAR